MKHRTPKAKVGLRVHVFSGNTQKDLGYGTITKVEPMEIERIGVLSKNYPSEITLDSGKKTEGIMCWWSPAAWDKELKCEKKDKKLLKKK
jgi:hypothetical protein